jgi:transcriptional regulator with XRE-family HTH domain
VSDLTKLEKFLDDDYLAAYLDGHVKGSIAYQIQALRAKLGLNQAEFGELIGMPQSVVSRLEGTEYGGTNVNTLLKIAIGLKIGLKIRFCGFEEILDADVSPSALAAENIQETVNRLGTQTAPRLADTGARVHAIVSTTGSQKSWQMQKTPHVFHGSGTLNSVRYMPTELQPASLRYNSDV